MIKIYRRRLVQVGGFSNQITQITVYAHRDQIEKQSEHDHRFLFNILKGPDQRPGINKKREPHQRIGPTGQGNLVK